MADPWRWRPPTPCLWPPRRGAPGRRALIAACLGLPLLARRGNAGALPFADGAHVLVAGPAGGRLDRCADDLLPALLRELPAGTRVQRTLAGGADGVTGANQFEARGAPDGASLLLMPGAAALAWLIGDPRARFHAGDLVTVLAGVAPGVMMSRQPIAAAAHLRIAAGRPDGPDLAGLLALDLLGLRPQPAFGLSDTATVEHAILTGATDAVFVAGPDAPQRVARLVGAGLAPVFTLGVPGDDGDMLRDPLLPDVPSLPELVERLRGTRLSGTLYDAWRAVSAAAQLNFVLALPALTPASLVSLWREAAVHAVPRIGPPEAAAARVLACPEANRFTAPIAAADAAMLIELRHWLASRLGWQPV